MALDARTGAIEWGHTEMCNDGWDYDTDQSLTLFDVRVGGRTVPAVGDASKAGFYSTLDARTGALIARTPELVRYTNPHLMPTRSGALVCPGIFGGLEYGQSGAVVWRKSLPGPAAGGPLVTGSGLVFAGDDDGNLYAFAASTGRVLWRAEVGLRFGSAPIAYEIDGKEYIAVVAGGSAFSGDGAPGGGELFVFNLSP